MTDLIEKTPDYMAIKQKQQATWASGDYAIVGTTLQIVGEQLCEAMNLRAGSKVLDVAAGNGNATLAAARRFCDVTSTDYVETLLNGGRRRAIAEDLSVDFQIADAEDLPFEDGAFDAVVSTFGVMFAPNQEQAAHELARACRSGGMIGLSNWTSEGFIGRVFKIIGKHVPPPPGVNPPSRWGDQTVLHGFFKSAATEITLIPRSFVFRYLSVEHFMEVFKTYYGPIHKAFAALGDEAEALDANLRRLLDEMNTATDGTLILPSAYVDVVIIKS